MVNPRKASAVHQNVKQSQRTCQLKLYRH